MRLQNSGCASRTRDALRAFWMRFAHPGCESRIQDGLAPFGQHARDQNLRKRNLAFRRRGRWEGFWKIVLKTRFRFLLFYNILNAFTDCGLRFAHSGCASRILDALRAFWMRSAHSGCASTIRDARVAFDTASLRSANGLALLTAQPRGIET